MGSQAPLGKGDLFKTPGAELPGFVREVARALMRNGKPKSQAIQIAIGQIKRWAAEGNPKAVRALAQWEAAKAKARATPNKSDHATPRGAAVELAQAPDFAAQNHAMIALEVPAGVIPGQDDAHLTVSYLGVDISDREFAGAISRALMAAQETKPIVGSIGGLGVFPPKDDTGLMPVWATVDAPELARLHDYVRKPYRHGEARGFTPHITLRWIKPGEKLGDPLPKTPVTFTHLIVKRGGQQFRFELGGDYREWSNPLATTGRQVLLAQAPEKTEPKKAEKKSTADKSKLPPGATGWKHGWVPVDDSGKPVGPAQPPKWLQDAKAKHKAAGGRTAEEIAAEKLKTEKESRARKAAAPAKKAKAAEEKKAREAKAAKERATRKAEQARKEKERAAKRAERDKEQKTAARERQIKAAYRQALADRKAGRELSEQQRRVVAYVEARERKEQGKLRRVDVPGADGSKVASRAPAKTKAATAPKKTARRAQGSSVARRAGAVTTRTASRKPSAVRAVSYDRRGKRTVVRLAGDGERVNVLDFAGKFPKGQLAFRYKHGWILINPAIPSRGAAGGALARKHGVKSGSVTHGHFEPAAGGKKKFVPERSGGENNPAKLKAVHSKLKGAPTNKDAYTTAAAMKDTGGNALKPNPKTPAEVKKLSADANAASVKANSSKSLQDAQVAAKKHADAFVQAKKAGDTPLAESHKANAQAWAKKAQQIKQAEKASAEAKKKYEEEQKAKAAEEKAAAEKAEAEAAETKKKAAQEKAIQLITDAQKLHDLALNKKSDTASELTAKAQQYKYAADKWTEVMDHMEANDLAVTSQVKAKKSAAEMNAAEFAKKAAKLKAEVKKAHKDSDDAWDMSENAEKTNTATAHHQAAKEHQAAGKAFGELGMDGDKEAHFKKASEHMQQYHKLSAPAPAPEVGPGPGMQKKAKLEGLTGNIDDVIDDIIDDLDIPGSTAAWEGYLHATAVAKVDPTPANLKKMSAAQKALLSEGVTGTELQQQAAKLFKKQGLVAPAKKAAAKPPAKKASVPPTTEKKASDYVDVYKDFIADGKLQAAANVKAAAIQKGLAKESDFPELPKYKAEDFAVTLPGPGMYKDGNAVTKAYQAANDEAEPAKKAAMMQAADNAAEAFKAKHGKEFDKSKVEAMFSPAEPFVPQHGGSNADHPFFNKAKEDGYEPVSPGVSANGNWKPSDVPGLKSNKGAYTYSGGAYSGINQQLRHGVGPSGGQYDANVKQMDKEFDAVPGLAQDIVTMRSMSGDGPFDSAPPYMQPGGVFVDPGYSSTSKVPGTWSGNTHMEVRIPKGTKVLDLNHTTGSQHSGENEILLDRDTHYKIVSDGPNHTGSGRLIVVEVVPGPKKPQKTA